MTKSTLRRVDSKIWRKVQSALPGLSDRERSIVLYNSSAVKLEHYLKRTDFKNRLGEALYGKKVWKKFK